MTKMPYLELNSLNFRKLNFKRCAINGNNNNNLTLDPQLRDRKFIKERLSNLLAFRYNSRKKYPFLNNQSITHLLLRKIHKTKDNNNPQSMNIVVRITKFKMIKTSL